MLNAVINQWPKAKLAAIGLASVGGVSVASAQSGPLDTLTGAVDSTTAIGTTVIGASLSEPNTSGTALHKCVCICACLWPYIVNFKRALKYFSKILRPHGRWRTMQGYCQSAASASQSEDGSSWSTHGNLLLVSLGSYGPTINGRLLADRTNLGAGLRSLQVRASHKKGTHRHQRSAHDFTVKLSLSMCGHSSCHGWRNVTACDLTSTQFGL